MSAKGKGGPGGRSLNAHVKRGRKDLKPSSRRWIERQLNDPYVQRAKAEGYRSRAAYKLIEIDDKHRILKKGDRVVDLGAAPGGWSQVAVQRTGSNDADRRIAAIDYLEMDELPGVAVLKKDFLDDDAPSALLGALGGAPDVVLSDMAAPTIGHRATDHMRTMHLGEIAADFAISVLKPGGHFLAKTFQGGTERALLDLLKKNFRTVRHIKPPASRDESVELFILATGFKGRARVDDTADGRE
ncbi:MAG TPA: RlmE family RNA methyltransferase, partial [Rhizobiaceae bacterium]|nr:RlmE family RNA methyltransferase [Rhizobiaceae bacterium]